MIMFGGFSHDISRGKWVSCSTNDKCVYYNDLWAWTPPAMNVKVGWAPLPLHPHIHSAVLTRPLNSAWARQTPTTHGTS